MEEKASAVRWAYMWTSLLLMMATTHMAKRNSRETNRAAKADRTRRTGAETRVTVEAAEWNCLRVGLEKRMPDAMPLAKRRVDSIAKRLKRKKNRVESELGSFDES